MALFLTLFSIVICYFSPAEIFPDLAPYHIQWFVIGPAAIASVAVFAIRRNGLQSPCYLLMIGVWFAVVMSMLSKGWLRSSAFAFVDFGLVVCVYFLVAINAYSLTRVGIICRVFSLCAIVMAAEAVVAYYTGIRAESLLYRHTSGGVIDEVRICGYGILHDPNDFAQFLLVALAFLGVSWRKHDPLRNLLMVWLPGLFLVFAIFLTGSRGAIFGLVAIAFVVFAGRIGRVPAIAGATLLFLVLMAAQFGGGRDISVHEGSAAGRIVAWGSGIADLKKDPLFGVGYGQFTEYNDLTAHNSFVLCFAELGFFGYFFWLALLITTILGLENLAGRPKTDQAQQDQGPYVTTIRAGLYAFLATSCFLSRTYNETLYILLALAAVLIYMNRKASEGVSLSMLRWVPLTFAVQVASIGAAYVLVRLRSL